jgi:glycosyltransferase involved in cell wall biosynthesis
MPAPRFGGAQRVTVNIANSLAARGYPIDLVTAQLDGTFVSEISDAVNTIDLAVTGVLGTGILTAVPKLVSYLEASQPAVLFASRTHTNIAAIVATWIADTDTRIAVTEHSPFDYQNTAKDRVAAALAAQIYPYADGVIAVSEGVAQSIVAGTNVSMEQITVLNNPIDLDAIQSGARQPVDHEWLTDPTLEPIVSVGRLKRQKGFSVLLESVSRLRESRPEIRLLIVGEGSDRDRLESLAHELDIEDIVSFTGYTDNPYIYMHHSSVFATASTAEGLPTVLIEALACGASIVSTDCQYGPREILCDGEYGRLTPVNDVQRMTQAIAATLDDPIAAKKIRQRAEHFSMEAGGDRYEMYIRNLIDN